MGKVTLDADLKRRLGSLAEPFQLCDERGQPLAHVLPESACRKLMCERFSSSVAEEELDRLSAEPVFLPLKAILEGVGRP